MAATRRLSANETTCIRAVRETSNVPRIATSIHLDSDEYAHFEIRCTYFKPNKTIKQIPGRLVGTNKKCYFLSDSGTESATIDWNNVSQTHQQNLQVEQIIKKNRQKYTQRRTYQTLHVTLSRGTGGGDYQVYDTLYLKILMDTLVRLWKRQLVIYAENKDHGAIPEHVKAAVFQRDGGNASSVVILVLILNMITGFLVAKVVKIRLKTSNFFVGCAISRKGTGCKCLSPY